MTKPVISPRHHMTAGAQDTSGVWFGPAEAHLRLSQLMDRFDKEPQFLASFRSHAEGIGMWREESSGDVSRANQDDDSMEFGDYAYMVSRVYDVAIVEVSGMMVAAESFWHRYMGVTSYQAIANAVITAAASPHVNKILLRIDSAGGNSNGIVECADVIKTVAKNQVPVYSYVSGNALSAGYWVASCASKIYCGALSELGSIGAISVKVNYVEALKMEGISYAIYRYPEMKALGHPAEPLSEKANQLFQEQIQYSSEQFMSAMAVNRKVTMDYLLANMGRGRSFIGKQCVDNKLADDVMSYTKVIEKIAETGEIRKPKPNNW